MDYAKTLYAYAYNVTGNAADAEDLSQEILLTLLSADKSAVRNEKAWVMGVCRHVWARFLKNNKPHWESVGLSPLMENIPAVEDITEDVEKREEYARLRREIAYLSRVRREVLVRRYFDGESVKAIAKALGVAPSTVRWHLMQARNDLKGRLDDMNNTNAMRAPGKLTVGYSGQANDLSMRGLTTSLLAQNAALACYGRKLTVEEVSRELQVPACYIENVLDELAGMDYMVRLADRYTTNFFIRSAEYSNASFRFFMARAPKLTGMFIDALASVLPEIRAIGFIGSDLPDGELTWHIYPELLMRAYKAAADRLIAENGYKHSSPLRPDGTRHWVLAAVEPELSKDADLTTFIEGSKGWGIKQNEFMYAKSMQYDFAAFGAWRKFGSYQLEKLRDLAHGEENREAATELIRDGYCERRDGKCRIMIPYFTAPQRKKFVGLLDKALTKADTDMLYAAFSDYAKEMSGYIPAFIDKNERAQWLTSFDYVFPCMYFAEKSGRLSVPDANIARRLATIVWENNEEK